MCVSEFENYISYLYKEYVVTFEYNIVVDISELNLPKSCTISFPNGKDDLMTFEISIKPDEGYYM